MGNIIIIKMGNIIIIKMGNIIIMDYRATTTIGPNRTHLIKAIIILTKVLLTLLRQKEENKISQV